MSRGMGDHRAAYVTGSLRPPAIWATGPGDGGLAELGPDGPYAAEVAVSQSAAARTALAGGDAPGEAAAAYAAPAHEPALPLPPAGFPHRLVEKSTFSVASHPQRSGTRRAGSLTACRLFRGLA